MTFPGQPPPWSWPGTHPPSPIPRTKYSTECFTGEDTGFIESQFSNKRYFRALANESQDELAANVSVVTTELLNLELTGLATGTLYQVILS